jgi:hypothetical protein
LRGFSFYFGGNIFKQKHQPAIPETKTKNGTVMKKPAHTYCAVWKGKYICSAKPRWPANPDGRKDSFLHPEEEGDVFSLNTRGFSLPPPFLPARRPNTRKGHPEKKIRNGTFTLT